MDELTAFLITWGYLGMAVSAFLAGSVLPFSSEAVMVALMAAGLKPWPLIIYGTVGNVAGSMFNYWIGHLGRMDWIERILRISKKDIDKAQRFMGGHGAWMGFFAFVPFFGEAITVVLGLMRANLTITLVSVTVGKAIRYILLVYGTSLFLTQ